MSGSLPHSVDDNIRSMFREGRPYIHENGFDVGFPGYFGIKSESKVFCTASYGYGSIVTGNGCIDFGGMK